MIRILFFLFGLAFSFVAEAEGQIWFTPGSISYHEKRDEHHNERNWGIGIEYDWNDCHALMVGEYDNSNDKTTHYLLYRYTPWALWKFRLGIAVGAADGYQTNDGGVVAGGAFVAVLDSRYVGTNLFFLPKDSDGGGWVLAAQLKVRF